MSINYVQLEPAEMVIEYPFTDPVDSMQDVATLEYMLQRLQQFVTTPNGITEWPRPFVFYLSEPEERYHRVAIAQLKELLTCEALTVVGFCGQKRPIADHGPVDMIDEVLITEFPEHPHLLSYSTLQLACGNSCNLVLFNKPQGLAHWAKGTTHAQAIALAPAYYTSVRLHNAALPGGLLSDHKLSLLRTKYFAYEGDIPWMAVRELL
jgi:hypothetical protein